MNENLHEPRDAPQDERPEVNMPISVSFTKLESFGIQELKILHGELLSTEYSEERGFGFDHISANSNILSARLIKRTPTTIPQFDFKTGRFVDEAIFLFSEVDFAVDANFHLIEIYGPIRDVPKVRVALYPLLDSRVQTLQVQFLPFIFFPRLQQAFPTIEVEGLTVNNFQHQEGVVGRYSIKSAVPSFVRHIVEQYGHDVTRLTCSMTSSNFGDFSLAISTGGNLRIRCDEDSFSELLNELKSVLFVGEGE